VGWTRLPLWWSNYDAKGETLRQRLKELEGVKILATIRAVHLTKTNCPARATSRFRQQMSCPPKDMGEYKNFVREVVRNYKDRVAAWQIENEIYGGITTYWVEEERGSIGHFISLFKVASEVIRQEDPGKPILAPGIALVRGTEFDEKGNVRFTQARLTPKLQKKIFEVCEQNVKKVLTELCGYFDAMDIHLYHTVESIPSRSKWLKKLMRETGCIKPIWSTEIAGPQLYDKEDAGENFYAAQAEELPLRLQAALNNGIEKVFYFHYRDGENKSSPDVIFATCGLVTADGKKKPAYKAMQEFMGVNK
ncbi:MAG: hypothetical protein WC658_02525, partial [Candidatus Omnitrophota bacterium]